MKQLNREQVLKTFNENKELIESRYLDGIEKYRKGTFTIKVDKFIGKKIIIKQKTHKFLFGCNAFMLDSFEDTDKEIIYKEKFANVFNQAVVPFYWIDLEPKEGHLRFDRNSEPIYRRPSPDLVLEFCKEYNIEPKGHCLCWNWANPEWLNKYSTEEKKIKLEKRFKEISERYKDKIPSFDILNESASNYNYGRKILFDNYDEYALKLGKKYFKNNRKILNETNEALWEDFHTCGKYIPFNMQLKEFIKKKLAIDEIGIQFHIFRTEDELMNKSFDMFLNAIDHIDLLELLNEYNLPMHISEITIPSYANKIKSNEEIQAELLEYFYKIWFSTKNMKSIVWWNLVDGYAAHAPRNTYEGENYYGGGLLHYDMSEKPAYKVLDRLINKEWKTNIEDTIKGKTYTFRGFYGDYEIIVDGLSYLVSLSKDNIKISLNKK